MKRLFIIAMVFTSCKNEYQYNTGQILMPDYACQDTLMVKDGKGLSNAMKETTGTDGDIDRILHNYCEILKPIQ